MLAYVFWHWPRPAVQKADYEKALVHFYEALGTVKPSGFIDCFGQTRFISLEGYSLQRLRGLVSDRRLPFVRNPNESAVSETISVFHLVPETFGNILPRLEFYLQHSGQFGPLAETIEHGTRCGVLRTQHRKNSPTEKLQYHNNRNSKTVTRAATK